MSVHAAQREPGCHLLLLILNLKVVKSLILSTTPAHMQDDVVKAFYLLKVCLPAFKKGMCCL